MVDIDSNKLGDFSSGSIFIKNNCDSIKNQTIREFYDSRVSSLKNLNVVEQRIAIHNLIIYLKDCHALDYLAVDLGLKIISQMIDSKNKMGSDDLAGALSHILCSISSKNVISDFCRFLKDYNSILFELTLVRCATHHRSLDVFNTAVLEDIIHPVKNRILDPILDSFCNTPADSANYHNLCKIISLLIENNFVVADKINLEHWYIPYTEVTSAKGYIPSPYIYINFGFYLINSLSAGDIFKAALVKYSKNCELIIFIYIIDEVMSLWGEKEVIRKLSLQDSCRINEGRSNRRSVSDVALIFGPVLKNTPLRNFSVREGDTEALILMFLLISSDTILNDKINEVANGVSSVIGNERFDELFNFGFKLLSKSQLMDGYTNYLRENFKVIFQDGLLGHVQSKLS
ncbi:hypothetical protein OCF84_21180 (plasmid) [Shewanella xiamenensis]|uniref:Uncharacterized protein n=1 Tax=Shewanella xiamenensis TaxID=332186 RepID=A0ABT6UDR0_9GAMM|nr:hypothetical protein [Shewanella xiamenensis]MDI5832611.1 hypothetical protein [Shewanella xiamenensis]WHF57772.1 hypothetical protein OCF84_21180 [Shewanella xiamenensis]